MPALDEKDRRLLDLLQDGIPLNARPYEALGRTLGLAEEEVMTRIAKLKAAGVIRRIGAIFESRSMGFYSLLCAARVREERLEEVGQMVSSLDGVTHNYIRQHEYNLWFTLTAPGPDAAEERVSGLEKSCGIEILRLPASRIYKTRVAFKMEES